MNQHEQFDHIYNNLINGNIGDVIEICKHFNGDTMCDLMDYLTIDLNRPEATDALIKFYFRRLVKANDQ